LQKNGELTVRFDIVTIFPEFFEGPLDHGIVRRAREGGLVEIAVRDLREFTHDRHRTVDDRPFGGGEGMVLKPEPLFECVELLLGASVGGAAEPRPIPANTAVVLLSAAGKLFRQETARRYAQLDRVILLCGRYEGVDERVAEHLATEEVSIGDYVLSGGELPAAIVVDAVTRLLPGALGNVASAERESFSESPLEQEIAEYRRDVSAAPAKRISAMLESLQLSRGLLDYPHYTRPAEYRGWVVPEVLLSGNHAEVEKWRRKAALEKTLRNRPDLLSTAILTETERHLLAEKE
jgi:tRNA (guanine37-N1)-methyltransferase